MTTQPSNFEQGMALFMPFYNEEGNAYRAGSQAIEYLGNMGIEHTFIAVNDGSTDGTAEELADLQHDNPDTVEVTTHPVNRGYGAALQSGFKAGLETGHELIGFLDGDCQFDPYDITKLALAMGKKGTDAAFGIREHRSDNSGRIVLGKSWKFMSRLLTDCTATDVDCGMKLFSRNILAKITPELTSTAGAAISPEIVGRIQSHGGSFSEVPVGHYSREFGKSTGSKPSVVFKSVRDIVKLRRSIDATSPKP